MRARVVDEDEGGDARENFLEGRVPRVEHGEEERVGTDVLNLAGEAANLNGKDERCKGSERAAVSIHVRLLEREAVPLGKIFGLVGEEGKNFLPAA